MTALTTRKKGTTLLMRKTATLTTREKAGGMITKKGGRLDGAPPFGFILD